MRRLPSAIFIILVVAVALQYVPFVTRVSVNWRTTTMSNTRTSTMATEVYQAFMTVTILWTRTTMQMGGSTATIPIPYSAVVSDVVRTYTVSTTVVWREITTITYSSSSTTYEPPVRTHPVFSFLLVLTLTILLSIVVLLQRGMVGEDVA